jgi:hypothetical protein
LGVPLHDRQVAHRQAMLAHLERSVIARGTRR